MDGVIQEAHPAEKAKEFRRRVRGKVGEDVLVDCQPRETVAFDPRVATICLQIDHQRAIHDWLRDLGVEISLRKRALRTVKTNVAEDHVVEDRHLEFRIDDYKRRTEKDDHVSQRTFCLGQHEVIRDDNAACIADPEQISPRRPDLAENTSSDAHVVTTIDDDRIQNVFRREDREIAQGERPKMGRDHAGFQGKAAATSAAADLHGGRQVLRAGAWDDRGCSNFQFFGDLVIARH